MTTPIGISNNAAPPAVATVAPWSCPLCEKKVGNDKGVVPMLSLSCAAESHIVCYTCLFGDAPPVAGARCSICLGSTLGFVPLRALVNEQADDIAAKYIAKFFGQTHALSKPAVLELEWRMPLDDLIASARGKYSIRQGRGQHSGPIPFVQHNPSDVYCDEFMVKQPATGFVFRSMSPAARRALFAAQHAVAAFDKFGEHIGQLQRIPWLGTETELERYLDYEKRQAPTDREYARLDDDCEKERRALNSALARLCRPLGIELLIRHPLNWLSRGIRYQIRTLKASK